ncbi:MAG: tetratricopeptide repeat protein [Campylobacterota bacterium]|nr:tetratricopeptide repeat protein [Campylobacterota bacterium]
MRRFYLLITLPIFCFSSEPSVFGAGNLDSPNPYGLTSAEKNILNNKSKLTDIKRETSKQQSTIQSIDEKVDGMIGVVDGINQKSHQNFLATESLKKSNEEQNLNIEELKKSISDNTQTIAQFKIVLQELSKIIDDINRNYVSKDEHNELIKDVNDFKVLVAKELKQKDNKTSSSTKSNYAGMSNSEIEKSAYEYYTKKYYTKSIEQYEHLIKVNYHPARSNYMVGLMNYKRKKYDNALSYFKKSASLYNNADYTPTLMLYSATSMQKLGDIKNAKAFFNALIKKYPSANETKSARKALNSLN